MGVGGPRGKRETKRQGHTERETGTSLRATDAHRQTEGRSESQRHGQRNELRDGDLERGLGWGEGGVPRETKEKIPSHREGENLRPN